MHRQALKRWAGRLVVGGLAAALLLAGPLAASGPQAAASAPAAPAAVAWTATLVGQYGGAVTSVAVSGPLAYVGRGPRLQIYDLAFSNPPALLGQSAVLPALVEDVARASNYAFVALGTEGVWILDVSDWDNITGVGVLPTSSPAENVVIANDLVYVGAGSRLYIYSLDNLDAPEQVGLLDTGDWIVNLAVSGNMAYLVYNGFDGSGLKLADVSDPAAPTVVKTVEAAGSAVDVAVLNGYAYVASDGPGLEVIDVEPAASASVVGATKMNIGAGSVTALGGHAFVGEWLGGVHIIDITTPTNPTPKGYLDTPGRTVELQATATRLYMANMVAGMARVNIVTPTNPTLVANTPGDMVLDVTVGQTFGGNVAVLANNTSGVTVVGVDDPTSPELLDTFHGGYFRAVVKSGPTVYAAETSAGLRVLQVANPENVTSLGSLPVGGLAMDVAVQEGLAYVPTFQQGLSIANLNPLEVVGSVKTPGQQVSVAVTGTHAFMAAGTADLQVVDVSNPISPSLVFTVPFSGNGFDVAVRGSYAYVAAFGGGLVVVDITDPQTPSVIGQLAVPGAPNGVTLHGNLALLASQGAGVVAVDVSNPAQPVYAGHFRTHDPNGVFVNGNHVYVADGNGGLVILRQQLLQEVYLPMVRR